MAVLDDVVLVADGGDVTVGRQTATFVYGEFNVVLPHGREKVETDDRLQDGYVYRPKGGIKGPFDVGFVRADATVDLEADTSDLEVVVDAAQRQVEGDVFFERDITTAGLGQFVLDRDFRVGDVVTVELWGKRLRLPVTAGDYVASVSEGPAAARVHVGGQLISDAEAVARQNGDLRRQIAREKAERVRQVSSESSARRTAVDAEREARVAGDAALSDRIDKLPTSESLNADIMGLNERIKALGGESAAARDALMERLRGELAEASGAAASAREGLQRELEGKITALGGAQDEARRRDMEALNGKISGLNTDLTLLKQTEINALQQKWNRQQGEINAQNEQYRKLQNEWNRQQGEINDQNAKYQALDAEWKKQQHEINRQGSEFRQLQTVINDKQTGINALNTRFQAEQQKINQMNVDFRAETQERQRQDEILNAGQELALKHAQAAIDAEEKHRMRFATLSGNQVENWIVPDVSNGCFEMRRFRQAALEVKKSAIYVKIIKPCEGHLIVFSVNSGGGVGMSVLTVDASIPVKTELEVSGVFNQEVQQVLIMTNVTPI